MKKIADDWRLIYKVCSLYYEDNMRQQEICEYLRISRTTVCRMLRKGRESGIVRVEVINPVRFSYGKLEKALERKYGLKEVVVVEDSMLDTEEESSDKLYERAALFLSRFFREGDYIGVTMGSTLHHVVNTKQTFPRGGGYMFVPVLGGVGQNNMEEGDLQCNHIAREFACKFGGTYTQFLSPVFFSDKKILACFLQEKAVNFIFDDFRKLNTLVTGIGIPERAESTLIRYGYITPREMDKLVEDGMVGDVAFQFFDQDGHTEKFQSVNERVAGMPGEMMMKVRHRIGIAGGVNRVEAIKGAVRGGFVNMLITDSSCAEKLL